MRKKFTLSPVIFISMMMLISTVYAGNGDGSAISRKGLAPKMVSVDAIVDGVSMFLLERAEVNLIYVFEKKIKNSEMFECYFPNTRNQLKYGQLQEWLLFPRDMWKVSIEKDIELFALRSTVVSLEKNMNVSGKATALADAFLKFTKDLVVEFDGKNYSLAVVPVDKNDPRFKRINGFSEHLSQIVTALNAFRKYTSPCDSPKDGIKKFKESIEGILRYEKYIAAFRKHVKDNKKFLHLSEEKVNEFCRKHELDGGCSSEKEALDLYVAKLEKNINKQLSNTFVGHLDKLNNKITNLLDEVKEQISYTGKVKVILDKLDQKNKLDSTQMKRLSRASLFFAAISDSKSGEEVKVVLQAYTLQPVSYYTKREKGTHVNITAYLGLARGFYDKDVEPEETLSIFSPIGLEISRGLNNGGSMSIMLSPFDFGYPITQQLNGNKDNSNLDDVLAPSLTMSYGFKDLPLTVGVGYQQGRYISALNKTEKRWLLFFAFDMPLFNF